MIALEDQRRRNASRIERRIEEAHSPVKNNSSFVEPRVSNSPFSFNSPMNNQDNTQNNYTNYNYYNSDNNKIYNNEDNNNRNSK